MEEVSKGNQETTIQEQLQAKREASRHYEKFRRKRRPLPDWQIGRPWLKYEGDVMFCTWCIEAHFACSFVNGSKAAKLESVKSHEVSKTHLLAVTQREELAENNNKLLTIKSDDLKSIQQDWGSMGNQGRSTASSDKSDRNK